MSIKLPTISWETIISNTSIVIGEDYKYNCTVTPININDPGYGQLEVGYYIVDYVGHIFEIEEISGYDIKVHDLIQDTQFTGPYNDKNGYVYSSLKEAALVAQAKLNRLDRSAEDFVRSLALGDSVSFRDYIDGAFRIYGGIISDNGDGTINLTEGKGMVHTVDGAIEGAAEDADSHWISPMKEVKWDAVTGLTLTDNAYNYVYYDYETETIQSTTDFYSISFHREFTLGRVYRNGNDVVARICGTNAWAFDKRVQLFGEERFPVERARGMMIGNSSGLYISVTAGILWAELVNRFSVSAFDSSGTDVFSYWYQDGLGGFTKVPSQSEINNLNYDDGSGTLAELTANRYGVHWIYEVHNSTIHVVYGRGNYTLNEAQEATAPSNIPGLLGSYATLVGKIIVQKSSTTLYSIESPFIDRFTVSGVTDHSQLSNLTVDDHSQYAFLDGRDGDIQKIDQIDEFTVNAGVTIDSVLLKDGNINIESSISFNRAGAYEAIFDYTLQSLIIGDVNRLNTVTSIYLETANNSTHIYLDNSGNIEMKNNVNITGNLLVNNDFGFSTAGVTNIDRILDEDSFTSNSATALATQQSIKAYIDNAVVGYEWIVASVVAATTGNITISTALNDGDTIDGVALSTGDYVLVKDQTDKTTNGLYEVAATPARASEMDAAGEFKSKAMLVTGGTENGGSSWVCTTTVTTLGSDDIEFAKLSQLTSYTAGTGIDITGSTISLDHLGIEDLTDPAADRIMFWDDSVNAVKWLTVDSTLGISGTTLSASLSDVNYWTKTGDDLSYSSGNVGINKIDPSYKLDVGGTGNFDSNLTVGGTSTEHRLSISNTSETSDLVQNTAGGALNLRNNSGESNGQVLLRSYGDSFFNSGMVAIGKTNPSAQMDIDGNANYNEQFHIRRNSTTGGGITWGFAPSSDHSSFSTKNALRIVPDGVAKVSITEDGDITASGSIYADGTVTATGGNSTEWNSAYDHSILITGNPHDVTFSQLGGSPSDVIEAGTGLTWSGDTLNVEGYVDYNQVSVASDSTPNPTGNYKENEYYLTSLGADATFSVPEGTASNGNTLLIRIKDNGTSRTLGWNSIYRAVGVTLPTNTTASKTLYVGCLYNSTDSKWDVVSVVKQA